MRILVIYTGGVSFLAKKPADEIQATLERYAELQLVAETVVNIISNQAGADTTWDTAVQLGHTVNDNYATYDGFVIVHGVDNVLAIANLFTFLFGALGKPVIFTGCPLGDETLHLPEQELSAEQRLYREIGFRTNLITAVQVATSNCAGTLLAYSANIVRTVRAIETNDDIQPFQSWHESDVAEVQFGIRLAPAAPLRHTEPLNFVPAFSRQVYIASPGPELKLPEDIAQHYRAIVLTGYREQILPTNVTLPDTLPTIIHTQSKPKGALTTPGIIVPNATWPVVLTKTMAVLAQTETVEQFLVEFQKNRFGEFYPL